jgi:hypothetical protein
VGHVLDIGANLYQQLERHLRHGRREQVAFAFAEAILVNDGVTFRARDLYLVEPSELSVQESYHVSLTDEVQAAVIKLAWGKRLALVEFHSHTSARLPAEFSYSDLAGLAEFVPHIRWRLQRQPYMAIVMTPSGLDALVWRGDTPEPLEALLVEGRILIPTGLTIQRLSRAERAAYG